MSSLRPKMRGAKERAIVDPSAWDSSEVGTKEGASFDQRAKRKSKVSSVRSSLFQKNAKKNADGNDAVRGDDDPVFTISTEIDALQAPFQFANVSLEYCQYGKANKKEWTKDILALLHNAVRSELKDLTTLLHALKRLEMRLKVGDFSNVRGWFQVCTGVILDYLDLESKYLLPWISDAVESGKVKDSACEEFLKQMPDRQKDIRDIVMNASKAFGDLCNAAPPRAPQTATQKMTNAQKALLILGSLDALIFHCFDYMLEQEKRLPELLTSAYKSEKKEREAILKKIIKFVTTKSRRGDTTLVLLTRWMSDSKAAKSFVKTVQEIHECNYNSLQTQFEMNHAGFVHQFKVKAGL